MSAIFDSVDIAVTEAVGKVGGTAARLDPLGWRLALRNGHPFDVMVALDSAREWLHFESEAMTSVRPAALWRALLLNAALPGPTQIGLRAARLHLFAEVPLDPRDRLSARSARVCSAFKNALALLKGEGEIAARAIAGPGVARAFGPRRDLAAVCRTRGWNVSERANGALVVDLDCPGRFHQAVIETLPAGGVSVTADLMRQTLSPTCRTAVSTLLLTATATVRLARAAAIEEGDRAAVRFEVALDREPDDAEVDDALSALSAACDLAGDEARALQEESVAARYLAGVDARNTPMTTATV